MDGKVADANLASIEGHDRLMGSIIDSIEQISKDVSQILYPCLSDPVKNSLASGGKLKEVNANRDGKSLVFDE